MEIKQLYHSILVKVYDNFITEYQKEEESAYTFFMDHPFLCTRMYKPTVAVWETLTTAELEYLAKYHKFIYHGDLYWGVREWFMKQKPSAFKFTKFTEHETFNGSYSWWSVSKEGCRQRILYLEALLGVLEEELIETKTTK